VSLILGKFNLSAIYLVYSDISLFSVQFVQF